MPLSCDLLSGPRRATIIGDSARSTGGGFRNTKKAGRTKERAREKVGSLVGQRWCCSFPSSGLRHPHASRATRARTPTLARWCTWRYAAYARTMYMRVQCIHACVCPRVCLAGLYVRMHIAHAYIRRVYVYMYVARGVHTRPPTSPPT